MGRTGSKFSRFCLHRVTTHLRVRSPGHQYQSRIISNSIKASLNPVFSSNNQEKTVGDAVKPLPGRKIMIVVDSSDEAKAAVQWALSHTVQSQDTIVLLHVTSNKFSKLGMELKKGLLSSGAYSILFSMKNMCHMKRPEVQVEVSLVEGKEKGPIIVQEAKKHGVSLLVLGQRKRSVTWRLLMMWGGHKVGGGVVEYCIQNSDCMAIAVRRKSKKLGGYLITTKRHKDFWLLA